MPINRSNINKPGAPLSVWTISTDPFSFQFGAVHFASDSSVFGPSASPPTLPVASSFQFTQGVISFWMRYDSSVSLSGDSAKIIQSRQDPSTNSNGLLNCVTNPVLGAPNLIPAPLVGSIGITADPIQISLVLQDLNGTALVSVGVPYVSGSGTNNTNKWLDMGSFASLYHGNNSLWNGLQYGPFQFVATPCGAPFFTWTTGTVSNTGGAFATACINDLSRLPPPSPGGFKFLFQGVNGQQYPGSQFPAEVYLTQTSSVGGNPTTGWHHYIFSFDTSQLVTDANGAQTIRVQAAIDGTGGPVMGGALYDTKAGGGPLTSQAFPIWQPQSSKTGNLLIGTNDVWTIESPSDASVDFAYCYFGASLNGEGFYDLTNINNMRRFLSATGTPVSFGESAQNIPLDPVFMHTGDMGIGNIGTTLSPIVTSIFPINAIEPYTPRNPFPAPGTNYVPWRALGNIISTDGPAH